MFHRGRLRFACALLAGFHLALPVPELQAAVVQRPPPHLRPVTDVELAPDGLLHLVVTNDHNVPLSGVPCVVRQAGRDLVRAKTDVLGRLAIAGLRGGTYRITAGPRAKIFRVWTSRTAPPRSPQVAVITIENQLVRGQRPFGEVMSSDGLLLVGIVGAMIAIPIAVHQSGSRAPSSP